MVASDDMMGCDNWEAAESTLQKEALSLALGKAGLTHKDIRYLLAGDLLAQTVASSYGLMDFETPVLGMYGACSTCGEALGVGSMLVAGDMLRRLPASRAVILQAPRKNSVFRSVMVRSGRSVRRGA